MRARAFALAVAAALVACGIKAMPRPPLTQRLAAGDAGAPPFPDGGCFECPAGAR
ncbi:MAG TPA: hypothetical protein VMB50_15950 [Myxococcales bacterium]|nr:hypothetical protein [Myxococcales bacterium]